MIHGVKADRILVMQHEKLAIYRVKLHLADCTRTVQGQCLKRLTFLDFTDIPDAHFAIMTRSETLVMDRTPRHKISLSIKIELVCHLVLPDVKQADYIVSSCCRN